MEVISNYAAIWANFIEAFTHSNDALFPGIRHSLCQGTVADQWLSSSLIRKAELPENSLIMKAATAMPSSQ